MEATKRHASGLPRSLLSLRSGSIHRKVGSPKQPLPTRSRRGGALIETIDVIASLQVTRNNTSGTATVVGAGDGTMPSQTGVRVNLTANWTAKGGQPHTRQISMIFSPGGVSGRH